VDRAVILRAGAALFATAAFVGSGGYVVAHPKNEAAPLQPPAEAQLAVRTAAPSATPAPTSSTRATPAPRITTAPGVRPTALPGITFTHVS
jgi:ABC-type branched-subunit amino acid transport system permease subunit